MIKVTVVEDHPLLRKVLVRTLGDVPNMQVIGEASTGEEALASIEKATPDVLLLDVCIPGLSGAPLVQSLLARDQELKILMWSAHSSSATAQSMLKAGASGYASKGSGMDTLIKAINLVAEGKRYIASDLL